MAGDPRRSRAGAWSRILLVTAFLIGLNWLVYIYAVVSGHVLEGSLGYYLNPLVNVLLGVFLLKEKLSLFQKGAVLLAAAGVRSSPSAPARPCGSA